MHIVIGLALGLILVGLVMTYLCGSIQQALIRLVVYWTGVVMVVIGLVLLLTPVLVWVNTQIRAMLGA